MNELCGHNWLQKLAHRFIYILKLTYNSMY